MEKFIAVKTKQERRGKPIALYMPEQMKMELSDLADELTVSMSALIRQAVARTLHEHGRGVRVDKK